MLYFSKLTWKRTGAFLEAILSSVLINRAFYQLPKDSEYVNTTYFRAYILYGWLSKL